MKLEESDSENEKDISSANGREDDPLTIYRNYFKKDKLLTREEEVELSKLIQSGDTKAKDELVKRNMKLVMTIANQFAKGRQIVNDLVQEGSIGLIKAAEKFDHSKGVKFSTYAVWWIKAYIGRYLADMQHPVRAGKIDSQRQTLKFSSLDEPTHSAEGSKTLMDTLSSESVSPEEEIQKSETIMAVREAINSLPNERDRKIAEGHLLGEKTFEELGKEFGLSRERIRQIELKIKKQLTEILAEKGIKNDE